MFGGLIKSGGLFKGALGGAAIGAGVGAYRARSGEMGEGAFKGALYGAAVGAGASAGLQLGQYGIKRFGPSIASSKAFGRTRGAISNSIDRLRSIGKNVEYGPVARSPMRQQVSNIVARKQAYKMRANKAINNIRESVANSKKYIGTSGGNISAKVKAEAVRAPSPARNFSGYIGGGGFNAMPVRKDSYWPGIQSARVGGLHTGAGGVSRPARNTPFVKPGEIAI